MCFAEEMGRKNELKKRKEERMVEKTPKR